MSVLVGGQLGLERDLDHPGERRLEPVLIPQEIVIGDH
jgi:hypothetical protein